MVRVTHSSHRPEPAASSSRTPQACVECRLAKVRCEQEPSNICARCTSLGFDCVFVHHPRGRKPKSRLQGRDASSIGPAAHARRRKTPTPETPQGASATSSNEASSSQNPATGSDEYYSSPAHATTIRPRPKPPLDFDGARKRMLQALHRQKRRRAAPFTFVNLGSMDNLYQGRRESAGRANEEGSRETPVAADSALLAVQPMTLKRILQPLNADEDGAEGTAQGASYDEAVAATDFGFDDAVSQGLLPLFTARRLFHFFITHLNMWSMIIDPDLHTHDYVRRTSPFLYSVILHLAARFSVDEVYGHAAGEPERVVQVPTVTETECRHLQVIAKNHAATVFIDGDRTVEAVQAFFLLATWKEHDDALSYVQSGFAFRLAMDMELGKGVPKSLQKLALSEQEQGRSQQVRRLIELLRNRERCCLQLFVQDRSQAFHYIRHFTFSVLEPVISGAFEWYLQPGAKPWDVFLCASVECRKVQSKYQGIMTSVASAVADRDAAAAAIEGDLDAWHSTWARRLDEEHEQWTRAHDGALPPHAPQMSFMQASMALWRDSIKLHLVADLLEQDLRTTQSSSPSLRHYAHDYEPGATSNTGSGTATPRRIVNLVGLPAFSLCVRAARGVISALCSLPPAVLRHAPDSIHLLADHTGLFLCGMVCIRSDPPLSSEYLRTTLSAVERMRDALWQATIQESDSVALHARYLDSLAEVLRPTKKAPKPLSRHHVGQHQHERHTTTARMPRSGKQQQRAQQPAAVPDSTSTDQTHTGHGGPSRCLPNSGEYDDSASVLSSLGSMADLAAMTSVSPDVVLTAPADNWFESFLAEPVSSDGEEHMEDILGIINSHFGQIA